MHRLSPQASRRVQREKACLLILNNLLHSLRVPLHMLSLSECPSNLWYTLYLNIAKRPIAGIQSPALSLRDRISNVQRVLDALEKDIQAPQYIAHLDAQAVVLGNKRMLCDLVEIFAELDLALLHPDLLIKSTEKDAEKSTSNVTSLPTTSTTFTSSALSSSQPSSGPSKTLLAKLQQEASKGETMVQGEPSFALLSQSTEIDIGTTGGSNTPLRRQESFLTARSESPDDISPRSRSRTSPAARHRSSSNKRAESPYRQFLEKRMKQYTSEAKQETPKKSKRPSIRVTNLPTHSSHHRYYLSPTHGLSSSQSALRQKEQRMKMPVPSTKEGILQLLQKVLPGVSVPSHVQRHFAHAVSESMMAEANHPSNPYLRQAEQEELRKAKIELNERRRRVVRLTKESMDAQKEAHRRQLIRENLEEKVATDLLTKLLKYSASEQLEMARLEKDAEKIAEDKKRQHVMKEKTEAVQWLDLLSEALTSELKKATLSEVQKRSILESVIADAKLSYRGDVKKSRGVLKNDAIHEMTWRKSDADNAWEDVIAT